MPIDWWRGSPAILESQRYQAERELRSIGNIAGGVRSGLRLMAENEGQAGAGEGCSDSSVPSSPDQLAAAYSDSQSNVTRRFKTNRCWSRAVLRSGRPRRLVTSAVRTLQALEPEAPLRKRLRSVVP